MIYIGFGTSAVSETFWVSGILFPAGGITVHINGLYSPQN